MILGWTKSRYGWAGVVALLMVLMAALPASAQAPRRTRRESNGARKARVERTIEATYTHRWEVGGGPGVIRFRSGEYKQQNNEIAFWTSALYSFTPKLGAVALATGGFGSAKLNNTPEDAVNPQIQNYAFMGGPSYRFVLKERYSVSGYAAGGLAYGRFSTGPKDFPPADVGLYPSGLDGAFAIGVNLDYNFYPNLSARITPQYLGTTFGGEIQNNKSVNIGLVYRFGRIR